ncbi:unnamed protein product [Spodoptera exigua]|nr:unnamed protein product [Spodoptera exigua]
MVFNMLIVKSNLLMPIRNETQRMLRPQRMRQGTDGKVLEKNACLRCQGESKKDSYGKQDCVVVWGECNHSFHFCCMSLWVKQNNRCPLCQQEWSIQRMGK